VIRVGDRDLDSICVDRAALARIRALPALDALLLEPPAQLGGRDHAGLELLEERDRVADVVLVCVREQDEVDAFRLQFGLRTLRVPVQERIDVDALAARRVDPESGMSKPGERSAIDRSLTTSADEPSRVRRSDLT
jgi:hypothetical protein